MSQVTQSRTPLSGSLPSHTAAARAAALTLAAIDAVTLILALGNDDAPSTPAAIGAQPALRSDGGPSESAVSAAITPQLFAGPDESATAAAISAPPVSGPDESRTAAAISAP
jgi:hypothetical protein